MLIQRRGRARWGLCGMLAWAAPFVAGCPDKEPDVEIISLEGSVEKIDARPDGTGTVSVWYFSEKHGREVLGTGDVTAETEIMINGAAGKLQDLKVGDRVRGEVRIEQKGEERSQTALKIIVERAEPVGED